MYPVYTQNNFLCSYVSIVTEWVINYWVSDEVSYREAFVCRNLIKILWRNFVFQTKLAHGVLIYMWLLSVADSVHNIFLAVIFSICRIYTNLSMDRTLPSVFLVYIERSLTHFIVGANIFFIWQPWYSAPFILSNHRKTT